MECDDSTMEQTLRAPNEEGQDEVQRPKARLQGHEFILFAAISELASGGLFAQK